jgi:PspAB-like protein
VGFLDSVLGRTRVPKSTEDRLFAMSTAGIQLEAAAGLKPAGKAGVLFKRLPPGRFDQLMADVRQLLALQGSDTSLTVDEQTDRLGFEWMILSGGSRDYQDALAAAHSVGQSLTEEGLGDLLLACAFRFQQEQQPVYWIYSYKQASFYPFVPTGERRRDNAEELRLSAIASDELPIDSMPERWYALWDIPL